MNKIVLLSVVFGLTSCALFKEKPAVEKLVYVTAPLYAPPHSVLPTLSSQELQCLTPTVKQKILDRDRLLHNDRDALEIIIRSTQK